MFWRKRKGPEALRFGPGLRGAMASLRQGQRHGFFPAALGFEDQLDHLAGGAAAAGAAGDEVTDGGEFGGSVGDADGEAGALGEGNVGEIVAEVGYFFFGD